VALNLRGAEAVETAARRMRRRLLRDGYELSGLQVQRMAPAGVELIVGVVADRNFGPVLVAGAGGTGAELVRDISARITPLTEEDAGELLRSAAELPPADRLSRLETMPTSPPSRTCCCASAHSSRHIPRSLRWISIPSWRVRRAPSRLDVRIRVERVQAPRPQPSLNA